MNGRSRWPVRVKRGNSTVSIYKADRKKNGRIYREFKLAYYNEIGKRTLQSFNSFKRARKAADNVNVSLMKGEVKSLVLSNDDKVVYLRALNALKPTGTALDVAAHLFAELVKVLGGEHRRWKRRATTSTDTRPSCRARRCRKWSRSLSGVVAKPSGARITWRIWSIGWADSRRLSRRALPT